MIGFDWIKGGSSPLSRTKKGSDPQRGLLPFLCNEERVCSNPFNRQPSGLPVNAG